MTWDARACAVLVCTLGACSGPGNTGKSGPSPELVAAVPWTNGAIAARDPNTGEPIMPDEVVYPPIGANRPDPGSGPIQCGGLSGLVLSPWVETFEAPQTLVNPVGVAKGWSSNDDETKGSFRVPGDVTWYPGLKARRDPVSQPWGLAAERLTGAPSCDGAPNEWVLHFRGGRFNFFGAAVEHPLAVLEPCPGVDSDLCPALAPENASVDPVGLPLRRPDGSALKRPPHPYWDLSLYDGVTLWARRGPEGQPGMLFALQDKHTSDALNREHQAFCRRIKPCRPVCQNGLPCALNPQIENSGDPNDTEKHRCFDPHAGPPLTSTEPALLQEVYPHCGPSACARLSHYPDPDFDGLECKPYEFSGSQAGYYCYGEEPPPPDEERCGDAWVAPVRLGTDWKLYVIPFSEFRQVGFAKRAPFLDLHSIYSIALQFPVGYADVYVDNVSFYRRRR